MADASMAPGLGKDRLVSLPLDGASLYPAQEVSPSGELV
jgi:hypothetical protein